MSLPVPVCTGFINFPGPSAAYSPDTSFPDFLFAYQFTDIFPRKSRRYILVSFRVHPYTVDTYIHNFCRKSSLICQICHFNLPSLWGSGSSVPFQQLFLQSCCVFLPRRSWLSCQPVCLCSGIQPL